MDLTQPVLLTNEGLAKLKHDLEIALNRRIEAADRMKEGVQPGDIEDNPEYEQAKEEVTRLDDRISVSVPAGTVQLTVKAVH